MHSLLTSAIVLTVVVSAAGGAGLSSPKPSKVIFVHRHCARTDTQDVHNGCATYGCGMCTDQGLAMLKATGEDFRRRYGHILPQEYRMDKIKSFADVVPRTEQSASAFLKGLFAFNSSYFVAPAFRSGGSWEEWGATYELHSEINMKSAEMSLLPNITQYISAETIIQIGAELGLNASQCSGIANEAACLTEIIDFLASARAEGDLPKFPIGAAHWDQLNAIRNLYESWIWGGWEHYANHDAFTSKAGYMGHHLFNEILAAAAAPSDDSVVLTEYSGHDTTLMPLYSAMGNLTYVYPEFATSLVFEIYSNPTGSEKNEEGDDHTTTTTTDTDASNPWVLVKTALPEQLPGSHPLTWFEYEATCMNATTGQTYTSSKGCPLKDFQAFAATRQGTEPAKTGLGSCYAYPEDLAFYHCQANSTHSPLSDACLGYRYSCPLTACGKGFYMTPDFHCHVI